MLTLLALALFSADVRDLGDDSFAVRQAAQARLERLDWLSWRACAAALADPDPERRHRAARVVRRVLRFDVLPLLCSPLAVRYAADDVPVNPGGFVRLPAWVVPLTGGGGDVFAPDWFPAGPMRAATHAVACRLLCLGVPRPLIDRLLIEPLHRCERRIP